jgi:hypothetical protein
MAGVKVTDLTTLATAANDDIMYIVDTSSNTSKQIEVQDIYSGMPQFASGSFTPTISDEVDCTVTPLRGIYSRVNDVVTMTLYLNIVLDNAAGVGQFNVALPVASTFATARDCYGTATIMTSINVDTMTYYIISADTVNNKCAVEVEGNTGVTSVNDFIATIQYLVL